MKWWLGQIHTARYYKQEAIYREEFELETRLDKPKFGRMNED